MSLEFSSKGEQDTAQLLALEGKVDKHVKLFGAFTLLTTIIVCGMSVYVVHNTEFRFDVDGNKFVNDDHELMITANPSSVDHSLQAVLSLPSDKLRSIDSMAFFVQFPDGGGEVIMKIAKIVRLNSGACHVYGADGSQVVADYSYGEEASQANYTDNSLCPEPTMCPVIDNPDTAEGRRLQAEMGSSFLHGRKLGWGWFSSFFSSEDSSSVEPSPPSKSDNQVRCEALTESPGSDFNAAGTWEENKRVCADKWPSPICYGAFMNSCDATKTDATHQCSWWNAACKAACGKWDGMRFGRYCSDAWWEEHP